MLLLLDEDDEPELLLLLLLPFELLFEELELGLKISLSTLPASELLLLLELLVLVLGALYVLLFVPEV